MRAEPKKTQDVYIAAGRCELLVYDNLSRLEPDLSDALCRVATGGVHSTRTHHSNDEEYLLRAKNPVITTSIEDIATRGDFLSRAVLLDLPPIESGKMQNEQELLAEWEVSRPYILAGLFDALAGALRELPTVPYDRDCRMPHLAQIGAAAGRVLGWPDGAFASAYADNRQLGAETALEAQPVVEVICRLMDNRQGAPWESTASELLARLAELAGPDEAGSPGWPKQPHHLSGRLRRLAPSLLNRGIVVDRRQTGGAGSRKLIRLSCQATGEGASG